MAGTDSGSRSPRTFFPLGISPEDDLAEVRSHLVVLEGIVQGRGLERQGLLPEGSTAPLFLARRHHHATDRIAMAIEKLGRRM